MTIRKHPKLDGTTSYYVLVYDKRASKSVYAGVAKTMREAKKLESAAYADLEAGLDASRRVTLGQMVEEYAKVKNGRWRDGSKAVYRSDSKVILAALDEDMPLRLITRRDIDTFFAQLADRYAPLTAHRIASLTKQLFARAAEWEYVSRSPVPARLTDLPPAQRKREPRIITVAEHERMIAATDERYRDIIRIWPLTGMRVSEMIALTGDEVEPGVIHIKHQLDDNRRLVPVKTPKSQGDILVDDDVSDILMRLKEKRGSALFWKQPDTQPFTRHTFMSTVWYPMREALGIEDINPHDFRHTAGAWWIECGASLLFVQHQLRHANLTMTANTYSHLMDKTDRTVVNKTREWRARQIHDNPE